MVDRDVTVNECDEGHLVERLGHEVRIDHAYFVGRQVDVVHAAVMRK